MKFKIRPIPPFDFKLSMRIFPKDDILRKYEGDIFRQLIMVNNRPVLILLESLGTVNEPELELTVDDISKNEANKVLEIVNKIFNLDFDLNPFYEQVKDDKLMFDVVSNLWGLKSPATVSVFEALVDAIVEQQISLRVAHSIERKIIQKYGTTLNKDGHLYYAYPTPRQLNDAPFDELRECGLTLRKTEYIKSIVC